MNSVGGIRANSSQGSGMRAATIATTLSTVRASIQRSALRRVSLPPAAAAAYTNSTAAPELIGVVTSPSSVTGMVNQRRVSYRPDVERAYRKMNRPTTSGISSQSSP